MWNIDLFGRLGPAYLDRQPTSLLLAWWPLALRRELGWLGVLQVPVLGTQSAPLTCPECMARASQRRTLSRPKSGSKGDCFGIQLALNRQQLPEM